MEIVEIAEDFYFGGYIFHLLFSEAAYLWDIILLTKNNIWASIISDKVKKLALDSRQFTKAFEIKPKCATSTRDIRFKFSQ